jgi:hypothetical protein
MASGLGVPGWWLVALAAGAPDVVVFGGGWGPESNQAGIEVQVERVAQALSDWKPLVLFADGGRNARTVQWVQPQDDFTRLLGLVFDRQDYLHVTYRRPRSPSTGAATREGLANALDAPGTGPLFVFGFGHGSKGEAGAALELWGADSPVTVQELAGWLPDRPVVLVLAQCHSGGFHRLAQLVSPLRCVYTAVPEDREAAGCTPDADDPSVQTYAVHFARALQDPKADLDRDGKVRLAEAHRYANARDHTFNLPIDPTTAAVLDRWPDLRPGPPAVDPTLQARADAAFDARDQLRRELLDRLLLEVPELANPLHPVARGLLAQPRHPLWQRLTEQAQPLLRLDQRWDEAQAALWEADLAATRQARRALSIATRRHRRRLAAPIRRRLDACDRLSVPLP